MTNWLKWLWTNLVLAWKNMTVEPAVFVIVLADFMDNTPEQDLVIYKVCHHNFNLTEDICRNLLAEENLEYNEQIQYEFNQIRLYVRALMGVLATPSFFFIGAWVDGYGRKTVLFLYAVARMLTQILLILNAVFERAPIWFYGTFGIPLAIIGGRESYFVAVTSFLSDISDVENRAFRFSMLTVAALIGAPIGTFVGTRIYEAWGWVVVTIATFVGMLVGFIFMFIKIRSIKYTPRDEIKLKWNQAFNFQLVKDTMKTTFKPRPNNARFLIFLIMFATQFNSMAYVGERAVLYTYVRSRYTWDAIAFNNLLTFKQVLSIVSQTTVVPLLTMLHVREVLLLAFLLVLKITSDICACFAYEEWIFYVAQSIDLMGTFSRQLFRALLTACAPLDELGKIMAVAALFDEYADLSAGQSFVFIFRALSETFIGGLNLASAGIVAISLVTILVLLWYTKGRAISELTGIEPQLPEEGLPLGGSLRKMSVMDMARRGSTVVTGGYERTQF